MIRDVTSRHLSDLCCDEKKVTVSSSLCLINGRSIVATYMMTILHDLVYAAPSKICTALNPRFATGAPFRSIYII